MHGDAGWRGRRQSGVSGPGCLSQLSFSGMSQGAPGFSVPLWTKSADAVLGTVLFFAETEL